MEIDGNGSRTIAQRYPYAGKLTLTYRCICTTRTAVIHKNLAERPYNL